MSVFDELAEHAERAFQSAHMLPAAAYTSAEVLAAEYDRLFPSAWTCVGRAADIPHAGDYVTAVIPDHGDRELLIVRQADGAIAAFDNVCIHRGSPLVGAGCGNESRFTCPYHAWSYRLDGQLIGAPYMNETVDAHGRPFDPADHRLRAVSVEVWEGFIFVNPAQEPAALAPRLEGLTDIVGRYAMAGYVPVHRQVDVWDTNWKLLVENFMDAYHVFKVHKNSFAANGDNTHLTTMHPGTVAWAHHVVVHATEEGSGAAHPSNTALRGDWRRTIVLAALFPTFVMQLQPDWLWYLQLSPIGTDRVRIRWDVSVAPEMLAAQTDPQRYVDNLLALLNVVNAEDRPIVEGVRRGIAGAPDAARAPLSYLERNVYDFDRYVAAKLTAGH